MYILVTAISCQNKQHLSNMSKLPTEGIKRLRLFRNGDLRTSRG